MLNKNSGVEEVSSIDSAYMNLMRISKEVKKPRIACIEEYLRW